MDTEEVCTNEEPAKVSNEASPSAPKNPKDLRVTPPTVWKHPTDLPTWSSAVAAFIKDGKGVEHVHDVVREAAFYLQAKRPRPTSKEYECFSQTICDAIPELKKLPGTRETSHVS